MKTTLKSIITVCALVVSGSTLAQNLNSAYFLDGYAYGHEMNPAKEYDRKGYISFPVLGNINMAFRGNVGVKDFFYNSDLFLVLLVRVVMISINYRSRIYNFALFIEL